VSRLFIGNFDFEAGLRQPGRFLSTEERRRNLELSFAWLAVAAPGDAILVEELPPPEFASLLQALGREGVRFVTEPPDEPLELVPWGWNDDVVRLAGSWGIPVEPPPLDVVALTNRREFSVSREIEWGVGLDGQAACETLTDVQAAIKPLKRWLIKSQYSASGRDRLSGDKRRLSEEEVRWVERRLKSDGRVFVEPFARLGTEFGLQWDLPKDRTQAPRFIGFIPLETDSRGQYEGSRLPTENEQVDESWDFVQVTRRVAVELQEQGYFGPLGIDVMMYFDAKGVHRVRPLQDVNARWTMGRLAAEWDRPPNAGRFTALKLTSQDSGAYEVMGPSFALPVSPPMLGGTRVRHRFWLLVQQTIDGRKRPPRE
jgi:hypothetical protein